MKKLYLTCLCAVVLALGYSVGPAWCETVPVDIAPNVVNIQSQGTWVTVHVEIAYDSVASASVTLNGIPVNTTFADNCGDLVAKFQINRVKEVLTPGDVELTLEGDTIWGGSFSGTGTITVIDVKQKNGKN